MYMVVARKLWTEYRVREVEKMGLDRDAKACFFET